MSGMRAAGRRVWLLAGFVVVPVDELVTAWLGVPPLLPRLRWWYWRLAREWQAHQQKADGDVIDGEVIDRNGVWR